VRFFFDDFELDTIRRELSLRGERLRVDPLVVDLLACLVERAGEIVGPDELIARVWQGRSVASNVITVSMAKLRRALRQHGATHDFIKNVYGRGYRFVRSVERERAQDASAARPSAPKPAADESSPFVGREAVLKRLRAAHAEASAGHGSLCVLLGEAGIGKTRSVEAFERSAGARFFWGHARDLEGAPPLWPLLQILRELLAVLGTERVRAALAASFADLGDLLPELGASEPGARVPEDRFRVFESVLRLLALDASPPPRVIVLDDLHASDAATLELLAYITPDLSRLPLLVLATLRREERPETSEAQRRLDYVLGHRNCHRIELARLAEADVAAYAQHVLEQSSPELVHAVYEKSEGNPFFMVELMRRASEGGGAGALTFSDAALDLMRRRVRGLDDDARGLLSAAAAIGRSFDLGLLSAVTERPAALVLEHLDDAFSTDVVVAASDEPNRFVFGHDLIRDVLCEHVPQAELRRLRLRIGEALQRRRQGGAPVTDAELAHHFLGALPEGSVECAVDYARSAAQQASAATAYADAAHLLRRALTALDLMHAPSPRLRCDLHYQLSLDLRAFDVPGAKLELERAAELARTHQYADVLTLVGQVMAPSPGAVALPEASSHLEAALALLAPEDAAMRAIALAHLSWTAPHCDTRKDSSRLADEALACARTSGSAEALAAALRAKLYLGGGPERPEQVTRALIEELRRLTMQERHHWRARTAFELCSFEMVHALQRGDRRGFAQALDALGETAERFRFTELHWFHARLGMVERMGRGDFGGVRTHLEELRATGERLRLYAYEMLWGLDFMLFRLETHGHDVASDASLEAALPPAIDPPNVRALKLRLWVDLGLRDAARSVLRSFVDGGLDQLPCDRDYLGTLAHLSAAAFMLDEHATAQQLYALLAPHGACFATDVSLHPRGSIAHWLGVLARMLGKRTEAEAHLAHAIAQNEAMSFAPRAAESRYELARTLMASDDASARARARTLCEEALRSTRAMGMQPLAAKLARLQAELGGEPQPG
jgi:DNA-binding winged helix-turn-helix (wHTH) protein